MADPLIRVPTARECWDHDLDGWCPMCHGDPDRCPRTAREDQLAKGPVDHDEGAAGV